MVAPAFSPRGRGVSGSPRRGSRSSRGGVVSPRVGFGGPRGGFGGPRGGFGGPRGGFGGPRGGFVGPRGGFESPRGGFRSPRGGFRSQRGGRRDAGRGFVSPRGRGFEERGQSQKQYKALRLDTQKRTIKMRLSGERVICQREVASITSHMSSKAYGVESIHLDGQGSVKVLLAAESDVIRFASEATNNELCIEGRKYSITIHFSIQENAARISHHNTLANLYSQLDTLPSIAQQMRLFLEQLSFSDQEQQMRVEFVRSIEQAIHAQTTWSKGFSLELFGSSASTLGTRLSDMDMDLCSVKLSPNTTKGFTIMASDVSRDDLRSLDEVQKILSHHPDVSNVFFVRKSRVPVIKFYQRNTGVSCDMVFDRCFGVINSRLLRFMFTEYPLLKQFSFLMKFWTNQSGLSGGGGSRINSYSICLMVIFYFQQKNILPPLKLLRTETNSFVCKGTDCFLPSSADCERQKLESDFSIEKLLMGFLSYYGTFPFATRVISILDGESLSIESLPSFPNSAVNIQDPFETDRNTAKSVQESLVCTLRRVFLHTSHNLSLSPKFDTSSSPSSTQKPSGWGITALLSMSLASGNIEKIGKKTTSLTISTSTSTLPHYTTKWNQFSLFVRNVLGWEFGLDHLLAEPDGKNRKRSDDSSKMACSKRLKSGDKKMFVQTDASDSSSCIIQGTNSDIVFPSLEAALRGSMVMLQCSQGLNLPECQTGESWSDYRLRLETYKPDDGKSTIHVIVQPGGPEFINMMVASSNPNVISMHRPLFKMIQLFFTSVEIP